MCKTCINIYVKNCNYKNRNDNHYGGYGDNDYGGYGDYGYGSD